MADFKRLTRREFTISSAMAALSGVVITMAGCDESSNSTTPDPVEDVVGVVAQNHGHSAVVTSAQLGAGNTIVLAIQGTANHAHSVELTGAELSQIQQGTQVMKTSTSNASHTHNVTFN